MNRSSLMGPFAHIGIELPTKEAVDEVAGRAKAEGCLGLGPVQLPKQIGYVCFIKDPDGNTIEFSYDQGVYEKAARAVFETLDELEPRLGRSRFLFGARPVESDWRLFCTLVRFDAVYVGHFKCNLRRIVDYPNLQGYLLTLYQRPGIAATVNLDHIKRHYYFTHDDINPTRIVPLGPELDFTRPSGRS